MAYIQVKFFVSDFPPGLTKVTSLNMRMFIIFRSSGYQGEHVINGSLYCACSWSLKRLIVQKRRTENSWHIDSQQLTIFQIFRKQVSKKPAKSLEEVVCLLHNISVPL